MSGLAVEAAVQRHREGAGGNGEGVCAGGGDREARAVFACAEAVAVAAVFGGGLELEPVYGEGQGRLKLQGCGRAERGDAQRSAEHTSELQSLMRISYAVFCLKKKKRMQSSDQENHTQDLS